MSYQKGLNKNRNHHDSLSQSGGGRSKHDSYANSSIFDRVSNLGGGYHQRPYGEGKHNSSGKPKQNHW